MNPAFHLSHRDRKPLGGSAAVSTGPPHLPARAAAERSDKPAKDCPNLDRVSLAIDVELERFAVSSPIARGPAELSHAVLRLLERSDYLKVITTSDRLAIARLRNAFGSLIASALAQHAQDRGFAYVASKRSLLSLMGQLELWAKLPLSDTATRKRIRIAVQLALAEEFNANIIRL